MRTHVYYSEDRGHTYRESEGYNCYNNRHLGGMRTSLGLKASAYVYVYLSTLLYARTHRYETCM
jgi:hypothetical protein